MAELTVYSRGVAGVTPVYAAASAGGDSFINNALTNIKVKNADATNTKTITIAKAHASLRVDTSGDVPLSDLVLNVPPNTVDALEFVAPYGSYGAHPTMTYSSASGLSVAIVQQPQI